MIDQWQVGLHTERGCLAVCLSKPHVRSLKMDWGRGVAGHLYSSSQCCHIEEIFLYIHYSHVVTGYLSLAGQDCQDLGFDLATSSSLSNVYPHLSYR